MITWIKALIAKWKYKRREKQMLAKCGCVCYCPTCKDILQDQADCKDEELVEYHCNKCGSDSTWTFDAAPCPILLTSNGVKI